MRARLLLITAAVLAAAQIAVADQDGLLQTMQSPGRQPALDSLSVTDARGNRLVFERFSVQAQAGGLAIPFTRITLLSPDEVAISVQEHEGIIQSPMVGRRGVYAIRAMLQAPSEGPPPWPSLSLVVVCATDTERLLIDLPGTPIGSDETVSLATGPADRIRILPNAFPAPDEGPQVSFGSEAVATSRTLEFDGSMLSESR